MERFLWKHEEMTPWHSISHITFLEVILTGFGQVFE